MACAVCGRDAALFEHRFFVGDPRRPSEVWHVLAPLWFGAAPDMRCAIEGYCGPTCSLARLAVEEASMPGCAQAEVAGSNPAQTRPA